MIGSPPLSAETAEKREREQMRRSVREIEMKRVFVGHAGFLRGEGWFDLGSVV